MQSSLIGKIEKAKKYAQERDRISFTSFTVSVQGDHDKHIVSFRDGRWQCTCHFFSTQGTCSHSMAIERVLAGMLAPDTVPPSAS